MLEVVFVFFGFEWVSVCDGGRCFCGEERRICFNWFGKIIFENFFVLCGK